MDTGHRQLFAGPGGDRLWLCTMRILLTAFEPYGEWTTNSSWLTLVELLRVRPPTTALVTRRYPVDFLRMQTALYKDLSQGFDAVLHLGQSPGATAIKLESVALNSGVDVVSSSERIERLVADGPEAYRTRMPLSRWSSLLREQAIPAIVSYHAGTYLCNALMYLTHHWVAQTDRPIPVGFVHVPLATEQVARSAAPQPSLPVATLASALATILSDIEHMAETDALFVA